MMIVLEGNAVDQLHNLIKWGMDSCPFHELSMPLISVKQLSLCVYHRIAKNCFATNYPASCIARQLVEFPGFILFRIYFSVMIAFLFFFLKFPSRLILLGIH